MSVPIWLTLTRMLLATPPSMPNWSRLLLVTKRSSPTSWTCVANGLGQQLPAVPVVLGAAVLDRLDRVLAGPGGEELDHLLGGLLGLFLVFERVDPVLEELGGGHVEGEEDVGARLVAGLVDRLEDDLDGLLVALEVGAKPPSSPTAVFSPCP